MQTNKDYSAFNIYLEEVRDKPFKMGKFDCLIFTNTATRKLNGQGWADPYINNIKPNGKYLRSQALLKLADAQTGPEALDKILTRTRRFPPIGALLAAPTKSQTVFDVALGICAGSYGFFIGSKGLERLYVDDIIGGWI